MARARGGRRTAQIGTIVGLLLLATVLPALASGTVTLTSGTSKAPQVLCPVAADSAGLVYAESAPVIAPGVCTGLGSVVKTLKTGAGNAPQTLTGFPVPPFYGGIPQLVGNLLTAPQCCTGSVDYAKLGSATVSHFTIPTGDGQYLAGTSTGAISGTTGSSGGLTLYSVTTGGAATPLATDAAFPSSQQPLTGLADSSGDILIYSIDYGTNSYYAYYWNATTKTFVALNAGHPVPNTQFPYEQIALGGSSALWADGSALLDVPLTGAAGTLITPSPALPAGTSVASVAVAGSTLGFTDTAASTKFFTLADYPSSDATTSTGVDGPALTSDGTRFDVARGSTVSTAGLYSLTTATATPTKVVSSFASALQAWAVGIGPGRVAYSDDASSAQQLSAFARNLSGTSSLTAGTASLLASSATTFGLSLSGRSAAYLGGSTRLNGCTLDLRLVPVPGATPKTITTTACSPGTLSGDWLLYLTKDTSSTYYADLYNLVSGHTVRVRSGVVAAALWGNYLAWIDPNGSVWRRGLATDTTPYEVRGAASGFYYGGVYAAGPYVAWNLYTYTSTGYHPYFQFRNVNAKTATVNLSSGYNGVVGLSPEYVLASGYDNTKHAPYVTALRLPLRTTTYKQYGPSGAIDGTVLAWIDTRNVAHAELLAGTNRPWFLGNPHAPASVTTGHTWSAQFPVSAALTSAWVTIRLGTTKVAVLAANKAYLGYGVVSVAWKAGKVDRYTWTLSAANAAGSMLSETGTTAATTGTISVG
jgi:hypothetical protein